MKPTNNKGNNELSLADLLCATGYLPPRNQQDVERFERIYSGRTFESELYIINSNAIFDKVTGVGKKITRRRRPVATIFDRPGLLRVAESTATPYEESVAQTLNKLIKDKKD